MQLSHQKTDSRKASHQVILICDHITKAHNIGSLFRTSDAFGVEKLIFCGQDIPLGRRMSKTSRATEKFVDHEIRENILEVVTNLKNQGYTIIALEITSDSLPITNFSFPNCPLALILGDENLGVSDAILEICDDIIHIEMFGQNSSMNVVQATSIALYEMTKQFKR